MPKAKIPKPKDNAKGNPERRKTIRKFYFLFVRVESELYSLLDTRDYTTATYAIRHT
jgi:hypothetical protein